ncbi:hypothetical protein [Mesorhizobium loti]|uniref:hypothetical protein n=1 Tax=Rhizobium loti TaxID=381 RepID=UPI000427F5D2|nr:hypothetical protein [Mesorhizobium loti]
MVLVDLVDVTGYCRPPSDGQWMHDKKSLQGSELRRALSNARAEVVQHMNLLTLDADQLIAIARAARMET